MPVGRPFAKGVSPNPGGKTKAMAAIEREIHDKWTPRSVEVLGKLHELAMAGDVQAAKLFLERTMGPAKATAENLAALSDRDLEERICARLGITVEQLEAMREKAAMTEASDQ